MVEHLLSMCKALGSIPRATRGGSEMQESGNN